MRSGSDKYYWQDEQRARMAIGYGVVPDYMTRYVSPAREEPERDRVMRWAYRNQYLSTANHVMLEYLEKENV